MELNDTFKEIESKQPLWSTYICFVTALKKKFTKKEIRKGFKDLVDPEDYDKCERKDIVNDLINQYSREALKEDKKTLSNENKD